MDIDILRCNILDYHPLRECNVYFIIPNIIPLFTIFISPSNAWGAGAYSSQEEARKPGLQHHVGIDTRNPDFS